jgi:predicted TIM-barrel fold metal-dependent hydrolase
MTQWTRRRWIAGIGVALTGTPFADRAGEPGTLAPLPADLQTPGSPARGEALSLADYEPRSMLHVRETLVPRARFPVIDVHTHPGHREGESKDDFAGTRMAFRATAEELLAVMERRNVRTMVNLTGGSGEGLHESLRRFDEKAPGRLVTFTEPMWGRFAEPAYTRLQADEIARAHAAGTKGLKILKTLGLYLRERITAGPLVKIDDPRFDPTWEACGALGMPVAIHVSDPEAFFLPIDRFNERYEELREHPDWSFHGKDFPSNRELLEARNRVLARHPKTTFLVLHVGNDAEDLGYVGECLDRFPNMHVEIAARIAELGRQPYTSRRFFDRYQDRILFGTDTHGGDDSERSWQVYFRFLETEDEYFDYSPSRIPPQGRWRIYGLGLPESVLKNVYHDNAARILGLDAPRA